MTYMSKEEERKQEGEASPHPRLEALCWGGVGKSWVVNRLEGTGNLHSGTPLSPGALGLQSRTYLQ